MSYEKAIARGLDYHNAARQCAEEGATAKLDSRGAVLVAVGALNTELVSLRSSIETLCKKLHPVLRDELVQEATCTPRPASATPLSAEIDAQCRSVEDLQRQLSDVLHRLEV
jgi:hypothetical protein